MSEQFCDVGRGITLCHESFGDPADPTMLLVMGLGMQMVGWHDGLCAGLAERGFHVVRFDNRDAGRSTHMSDLRPPSVGHLLARRARRGTYTLSDMATDAAELLRRLELAPAHVVGASMGGMIAQTVAAEHPDVVRSLVSIMSNTGAATSGQPALSTYPYLLRPSPTDRDAYVERNVEFFTKIGSPAYSEGIETTREMAIRAHERGIDPRGSGRQLGAIIASGNRKATLATITAPTLVIHGKADKLVSPSGGKATARAIPGAQLELVDGMGHDLPPGLWPRLIDLIAGHAAAADGRTERAGVA